MSIETLVTALCRLIDADEPGTASSARSRAALAELRRALLSAEGAVSAYRHVVAHIPDGHDVDNYLLIGSLFGMNPRHVADRSQNLGAVCAEMGRQEDRSLSPASERRFVAMLSSRRSNLVPHLRRVVTMADRAGLSIDYVRLFYDLRTWDRGATRNTQLAWARSFYADTAIGTDDEQQPDHNDSQEEP